MIFIFEMHFIRYAYIYCILQISEYGTVIPKYRFESETLFYGSMKTTWQIVYSGFCDKSVFSVSGAPSNWNVHFNSQAAKDKSINSGAHEGLML